MEDGVNAYYAIRLFGEAHTVVSNAKAQFTRLSLKLLHIAFTGLGKAVKCCEDSHGSVAVEAADFGPGAHGPGKIHG
jgi:hypothetical protein